jgi:hypothetical protein
VVVLVKGSVVSVQSDDEAGKINPEVPPSTVGSTHKLTLLWVTVNVAVESDISCCRLLLVIVAFNAFCGNTTTLTLVERKSKLSASLAVIAKSCDPTIASLF